MKYLWILLIPLTVFAQRSGDKDRDRDLRNRDPYTGDTQRRAGDEMDIPSGGKARSAALSKMVPWRLIERWKMFDEMSNNEIFYRLDKMGLPPSGEKGVYSGGYRSAEEMELGGIPKHAYYGKSVGHFGWGRFFNLTYWGPKADHIIRFRSIPKRKKGHGGRYAGEHIEAYWETCRQFTRRVKRYWQRYYSGETPPTLPCTLEELPKQERRDGKVDIGRKPPSSPEGNIMDELKAPPVGSTTDKGVRTTYSAEDGWPVNQSQSNPGFHRATGSATLSSGQVVVDINTSVGAGKNDLSFQTVDSYCGNAWSTDTLNTNSYIVYPLSRTQIMIKSSSGADASTVNYRVEGD